MSISMNGVAFYEFKGSWTLYYRKIKFSIFTSRYYFVSFYSMNTDSNFSIIIMASKSKQWEYERLIWIIKYSADEDPFN
jgi:hypothetical protein